MSSALEFAPHPMRRSLRRLVLLAVLALGPALDAQAPVREAIRLGDPPIEKQIAGGQVHTFEINLAARDILRVKLDQVDLNLGLGIRGIDHQELVVANNANTGDLEFASLIAPANGLYSIDVTPNAADARPGKYRISILNAGPAGPRDETLVEGDRLFSAANRKRDAGTAQATRDAIEGFAAARDKYIDAGEDWRTAESWNRMGIAQLDLAQYKEALKSFEASRVVVNRIGDRKWQGVLLNNIGLTNWNLSQVPEALAAHQQALLIRREVGDRPGEASTLFNTALVYTGLGEPEKAIVLHEQTLPLRRLNGDKAGEVRTLSSLANAHRALGNFQEAFDNLAKARAIVVDQKDKAGEVEVLRSTASTYMAVGDLDQAQATIEAAIAAGQPLGNRRVINLMRGVSADILSAKGDVQGALDTYSAVIAEFHALGSRLDEVSTMIRVLRLQVAKGDLDAARSGQAEALALSKLLNDQGNVANAFDIAGAIAIAEKKPGEAAAAYREELAIWAKSDDHVGQADARYGLARARGIGGDREGALNEAAEALSQIELMRAAVRNADLRASFRARSQRYYELQVDLMMGQHAADPKGGHDVGALIASDASRARGLLESFGGNLPDFIRDIDPALIADRDAQARHVNELERRRVQAIGSSTLLAPPAADMAQAINAYRDAEGRVFAASPRYKALLTPPQVSLAGLRNAIGDDAVLVEYSLGEAQSFVWTVSSTGATSAVLPGRKAIEDAALKLHRAVTARNNPVTDATIAARRERLASADREAAAAAGALAKVILSPIEPQLANRKRIVLVVDGALSLVPFALLPSGAGATPLVDAHAIALLPSATMLAELRRPRERRSDLVAVFADPVFEPNDPRVTKGGTAATAVAEVQPADLLVAARRDGLTRFGRLRFSREEAEAIAALAPKGSHTALDFAATRADVESDAVSRARIVHFATHGIVNTSQPELSGLVLSLVDAKGQPQDGFLRLHDIYRLRLNADLVVLSACRSAVGRDLKGEGPMALTRGFLVAGAPRVVATIWDVDDRATAELMQRFYTGLLQRNEAPAVALRSAQMAMAATPQWSAPYYWAGFTLTGEWR